MSEPRKNEAYDFLLSLVDTVTGDLLANRTIAVGDFTVSIDGSSFSNLETLPVVTPAGSISVKISLSAVEMDGDKVVVQGIDAAGAEWDDVFVFIDVPAFIEGTLTIDKALRIILASAAGKLSGAATTSITIRDTDDTKDRVVATVDSDGNRTAVTLDAT